MDRAERAFIGLGTNLPFGGASGPALLAQALTALTQAGFAVTDVSSVWVTAAWPPSSQPDYYNAVVAVAAQNVSPEALYQSLRTIELRFGRERREQWAARTLDLDIIAMDGFVGDFGQVTLPHPRMHERAFVLAPLAEIAPNWRHPASGLALSEMLESVPDGQRYRRLGPIEPF
jgi:2-amino-4-hydroxy-6-hydroxymethyldihydropteridine diphosphokinase